MEELLVQAQQWLKAVLATDVLGVEVRTVLEHVRDVITYVLSLVVTVKALKACAAKAFGRKAHKPSEVCAAILETLGSPAAHLVDGSLRAGLLFVPDRKAGLPRLLSGAVHREGHWHGEDVLALLSSPAERDLVRKKVREVSDRLEAAEFAARQANAVACLRAARPGGHRLDSYGRSYHDPV